MKPILPNRKRGSLLGLDGSNKGPLSNTQEFHDQETLNIEGSKSNIILTSFQTILTALSPTSTSQKKGTSSAAEQPAVASSIMQTKNNDQLERLSSKWHNQFRISMPAPQLKGEEDVEDQVGILQYQQQDSSARDNISSYRSNTYSISDIHSMHTQAKENHLLPETKHHNLNNNHQKSNDRIAFAFQKNSAVAGATESATESNDDIMSSNLKSQQQSKQIDYSYKLSGNELQIIHGNKFKTSVGAVGSGGSHLTFQQKLNGSSYQYREGSTLFKGDGSIMQESIHQGSRSFRDDMSDFQNTIVERTAQIGLSSIWKQRSLAIIQKVARFMRIMLVNSRTKQFSLLRKQDFRIIGDLASSYKYFLYHDFFIQNLPSKSEKCFYRFSQQVKKNIGSISILSDIKVLKPYQTIKVIWDIFMLIITAVNIFLIVYYSIIIYLVDIIIILNTAFFEKGVMQENRKQIVHRTWHLGRHHDTPVHNWVNVIQIANVFFLIFFIAHLSSSGFVFIANNHTVDADTDNIDDRPQTWISKNSLENKPWSIVYINGLYWAIISMITIGYGDITPISTQEKAYSIFTSMVSCAVFAYSINTISQIITDLKQKQKKLKVRITNLNRFLQSRHLDMHLQMKVRKYIEHLQESEESQGSAMKDIEQIPQSIKEEVQIDIYGRLLRNIKLFTINFSFEAINSLAVKAIESSFGPGEVIFKKGESSEKIFVVLSGKISLSIMMKNKIGKDEERVISYVEKGQVFGVEDFFSGSARKFEAKALQLSQLIEISSQDITSAFGQTCNLDLEKYQMLRDKARFQSSTRGLGVQCFYCSSFDHTFTNCPNVTLSRNKPLCLAKYNYSQVELQRNWFDRRKLRQRVNTVANSHFVSKSIVYFLQFNLHQDHQGEVDGEDVEEEGYSEDSGDVSRPRDLSSASQMGQDRQKYLHRRNKVSNSIFNESNQTSIKLAAQYPSLMQLDVLDPATLSEKFTDSEVRDRSTSKGNIKVSVGSALVAAATSSSANQSSSQDQNSRIPKRILTHIAEERSQLENLKSSQFHSQLFHSNLNSISNSPMPSQQQQHPPQLPGSASNNRVKILRANSQFRNLTWNAGNPLKQVGFPSNSTNNQSSAGAHNQSNYNNNNNTSSIKIDEQQSPENILISTSLIQNPRFSSQIHNPSHFSPRLTASQQPNSNLVSNGSTFQLPPDMVTRGSIHYTNEQKAAAAAAQAQTALSNQFTPRMKNLTTTSTLHPNNKDSQLSNLMNTQNQMSGNFSQQLIQREHTQNSQFQSNSEINGGGRNNHQNNRQNDQIIEIFSVRNIRASDNWENDFMKAFDACRIFAQYFPHNNIDRVLERINGDFFVLQKKQKINKQRQDMKKKIQQFLKKRSVKDNGGSAVGGINSQKITYKLSLNSILDSNQLNAPSKDTTRLKLNPDIFSNHIKKVDLNFTEGAAAASAAASGGCD